MNMDRSNNHDSGIQFATAFYHASGQSPNAWTFTQNAKLAMYYRCMVVCYASIRRLYPSAQLALYSNAELPEPFAGQLVQLGVVTVVLDGRYVTDRAFGNHFPGCLYTLDVIAHLAENRQSFEQLILLDNDCIMRRRLDERFDSSDDRAIYAYAPGYDVNMVANGQSRASLTLALSYMCGKLFSSPIPMYGGEFFAIPSGQLPTLARNIENFWAWMKSAGAAIFGNQLTEEHVMSAVLGMENMQTRSAAPFVKRIWTTEHFSTVDGSESALAIWHLPSEKKKGLAKLYSYWEKSGFERLGDEDFNVLADRLINLQINRPRPKLFILLTRIRNALKYVLIGRL